MCKKSPLMGYFSKNMGVSKNRGTPKIHGENNGKPYEQMDDLGVQYHYFRKHPYLDSYHSATWSSQLLAR